MSEKSFGWLALVAHPGRVWRLPCMRYTRDRQCLPAFDFVWTPRGVFARNSGAKIAAIKLAYVAISPTPRNRRPRRGGRENKADI